jgi:hypothetical protein
MEIMIWLFPAGQAWALAACPAPPKSVAMHIIQPRAVARIMPTGFDQRPGISLEEEIKHIKSGLGL